jgi:N-acetylmuramoyl-L-alanine amidase
MENISIMGKATRNVADLNKFLKSKGCPEYAGLYRQAGEEFGVRWDMAIFQSCLETGWFWNNSGPFDVKKEQNNFAGLGAIGGGVPGDSFPDPLTGIRAQVQDLALRCDTYLPKESIISPYAKKHYSTISDRHSKTYEDLSGTWAADKQYHKKIYQIASQFDTQFPKEEPNMAVTWFNFGRGPNDTLCVQAMAGDKVIETIEGNGVANAIEFLKKHVATAGTWQTGPRHGGLPEPKPAEKKTTIFLDPGHSKSNPGARSNSGTVREEVLNLRGCQVMKAEFEKNGYKCDMWDPDPDNLTAVGERAGAYNVAISLHHNSYKNGTGNPYHCVMVDPAMPAGEKQIASRLCKAFAAAADGTIADTTVFGGTHGLAGVYEAELSVLNASRRASKPPFHILPEFFFLNKFTDEAACLPVVEKMALALAQAVMKEFPN